jgi:hypothetical protein
MQQIQTTQRECDFELLPENTPMEPEPVFPRVGATRTNFDVEKDI